MIINESTKKFAEKLVKEMIKQGVIKSEKDIDDEMVDRIIESIKEQNIEI